MSLRVAPFSAPEGTSRPSAPAPEGALRLRSSDVELVQRACGGDVDAFAELYDRHAGTVLALTRRILGAQASGDADDLLHDVFLEAWQRVREYDPTRGSVRVWLLVRARSRALDRLDRHLRERTAHSALSRQAGARGAYPPTERQIALRQALATLDPSVRLALELTYFEGLTAGEVSDRLHVPEGTVKSRLARGLENLQQVLSLMVDERPRAHERKVDERPRAHELEEEKLP